MAMNDDTIPELPDGDFARAMPRRQRERLMRGKFETGADVVALRQFIGLSQTAFASALGISVATLRNWEQDRRKPDGPALALLRIVARHPRILHEAMSASS
jgi:putative transcriptional regulator